MENQRSVTFLAFRPNKQPTALLNYSQPRPKLTFSTNAAAFHPAIQLVCCCTPAANLSLNSVTCARESRSTANCQIRTQSQVSQVFVTATFSGTSANAGPHYQKLYARVTHIWGNRKGQPSPSAMKGPRLERTASLITVPPASGKFFFYVFWFGQPSALERVCNACWPASSSISRRDGHKPKTEGHQVTNFAGGSNPAST